MVDMTLFTTKVKPYRNNGTRMGKWAASGRAAAQGHVWYINI